MHTLKTDDKVAAISLNDMTGSIGMHVCLGYGTLRKTSIGSDLPEGDRVNVAADPLCAVVECYKA